MRYTQMVLYILQSPDVHLGAVKHIFCLKFLFFSLSVPVGFYQFCSEVVECKKKIIKFVNVDANQSFYGKTY